jgi:hypothetical protein
MWGRLLCRIGLHRWGFAYELKGAFVNDYAWCKRRGCRYALDQRQPLLVNRERRWRADG